MASSPTDVAWVDVLPAGNKFLPSLRGITSGAAAKAGVEAGRIFGDAMATGISSATGKLAAAQKRAADATGQLNVQQARLNELQTKGTASADRLVAAQEAVYKAERNVALQTANVARAQGDLTRLQAEGAAASEAATARQGRLREAMGQVTNASGGLRTGLLNVNKAYDLMFKAALLSLPVLPFAAAAKAAGDYQSLLVKLVTTAGESNSNLKLVGDGMLKLAGQVGIGAQDLAKGMYVIESAGYHGSEGLLVLKAAAQGARQEQADLGDVANAVSTILHDYGLHGTDAARVTSQLVVAVGHGKTTFQDFTASLHSVTPVASKLGLSIQDVAATLASMTLSGETADQATENMRNAILTLEKPSQQMISELSGMGIQASDLQNMLNDPHIGLSGTLQRISQAILQHMGPSGKVMLDALNQSTLGAQGLGQMLGTMHGKLLTLSKGLLDGSVNIADYRKQVRDMGGVAGASGVQFLGLYQQSDGFNQILKAGGPTVQTYQQALQRATGTQATYTVALQTTRDNAGPLAKTLDLVAKAAADGKGNIQGWSEVQGTFNQKLAVAHATLGVMAIKLGNVLLPVLSTFIGWVTTQAVPGLEHFGRTLADMIHSDGFHSFISGITTVLGSLISSVARLVSEFTKSGGLHDTLVAVAVAGGLVFKALEGIGTIAAGALSTLVTWFGKLPGPLQAVVAGFAALKIAAAVGLFDGLIAATGRVLAGFTVMSRSAVATAGTITAAYREAAAATRFMSFAEGESAAVGRLTGAVAGLGAAAGTAAKTGLSALKVGLGGIVSFLGGGPGVAILAVATAVTLLGKAISDNKNKIEAWAVALNKGGQAAADAQKAMQQAPGFWDRLGFSLTHAGSAIGIMGEQAKEARDKADALYKAMTPVEQASVDVEKAQNDLSKAIADGGPTSQAATQAAARLRAALDEQKIATNQVSDAEKTHLQRLQDIANQELAGVSSALAAQQASLQFKDATEQLNAGIADGTLKGNALAEAHNALAQQAQAVATAAAQAAVDQAKQNGVTDLGTVAQGAMLKSLQESEAQLDGPSKAAVDQMIAIVNKSTSANLDLGKTVTDMGIKVTGVYDDNTAIISGATAAQIGDLNNLGYTVKTLPDGTVTITADDSQARAKVGEFVAFVKAKTIILDFLTHIGLANGGLIVQNAGGNVLSPMAGGTAAMVPPGTFRVIGDNMTSPEAYIPVNGSSRSESILSQTANAMGYNIAPMRYGGVLKTGPFTFPAPANPMLQSWQYPLQMNFQPDAATVVAQIMAKLQPLLAPAFSGTGSSGGNAANKALGLQIANSMGVGGQFNAIDYVFSHESGWNNLAQNPTSTAYGIPQFLDSTWATVGGHKTSDPGLQIQYGIKYMNQRYGSPNGAAAFWAKNHWYDHGGLWPSGTTGVNTTGQDERVLSPPQDNYFKRFVDATSQGCKNGSPIWHFYLGDREITDLVDARMEYRDDRLSRDLRSAR